MLSAEQKQILRAIILAFLAIVTLIDAIGSIASINVRTRCQVIGPTETVKVHDRPNGAIVNVLKNGRGVDILRVDYDERGRSWALIGGYSGREYRTWGYIPEGLVSCYQQ